VRGLGRRVPRIALPADPLGDGPTILRQWRDDDVPAIVALCQDPEIVRWIRVPAAYDETDARAYLDSREPAARAGLAAHFAIADDAGRLLGSISLLRFSWPDRRAEVGYWLGAPARGQGHASRAVRTICRWGFRTLSLERIELQAALANPASQRVAERTGFTREAVLRSWLEGSDGRQDTVCFGLLVTDPPS
jgi:RimJ/RimL family protein N-acetyltransferase